MASARYLLVEHDAWSFSPDAAEHTLRDHFKTASLDGFGLVSAAAKDQVDHGRAQRGGRPAPLPRARTAPSLGHVHTLRLWQREDV
jgi:hypothetical protein